MGIHSKTPGINLIENLEILGEVLGYYVKPEYPVDKGITKEAIDVAWFLEEGHKFPLMILEIESNATNASAANPLKVFGKESKKFEKPLFFFHIYINSGKNSAVIENLERQYGTNNYRVYQLKKGEKLNLVKDILSQHRRIHSTIDLFEFLRALKSSSFWDDVDISLLLLHLEENNFNLTTGDFLSTYAALGVIYKEFNQEFLRYLKNDGIGSLSNKGGYFSNEIFNDYIEAIYIGIISYNDRTNTSEDHLKLLKNWQENEYMKQIGPYFGLNHDYDRFILGASGLLWAIIAALMKDNKKAIKYISQQCIDIFEKIKDRPLSETYYLSLWTLHISSLDEATSIEFNLVRNYLNTNHFKVDYLWLIQPPTMIDIYDDLDKMSSKVDNDSNFVYVPNIDQFKNLVAERYKDVPYRDILELVLEFLSDCNLPYEWEEIYSGGNLLNSWAAEFLGNLHKT